MSKKLNHIKLKLGVNCELSSVAGIISAYDKTVDDSAIFFLENGFDINYFSDGISNIKELKLHRHIMSLAGSFLKRYGINYQYCNFKHNDLTYIINFIKESLKSGNPVLAIVDSHLLEHNAVFENNPSRTHIISIIGFENDGFIFSDCYVPTLPASTYEGIISIDVLNRAWKSMGWKYIDIDYDRLKTTNFNITGKILSNSVRDNLIQYISENNKSSGINCLYTFADDISGFTKLFTEEDIRTNIRELSFHIYFCNIVPAYLLLKKALLNLKFRDNYSIDKSTIKLIDTISDRWKTISFLLVKCAYNTSADSFTKISNYVKETLDYEKDVIRYIINLLS